MSRRKNATRFGVLLAALALARAAPAGASPLDDPHVGGIGFSGPASGDLAAVYWNPAALGLVPDSQVLVSAGARLSMLTLARAPIDPATGRPGGARGFAEVQGRSRLHPFGWPPGPGGLVAASFSLARLTFAVAAFSPYAQRLRWSATPDGQQPARYHAVEIDLRNLAIVPAISLGVGSGVRIGAAPIFLLSVGRLVFDEDTALDAPGADCGGAPCGVENPAAAARYEVSSGLDLSDSSFSFAIAGGVHVQRPRWDAGAAYVTRPLRTDNGVEIRARDTRVTAAPRAAGRPPLCPAGAAGSCFYGLAQYGLPDMLTLGFTYHLNPRLDLGAVLRWLNLSQHQSVDIRVVGVASGGLRAQGLPQQLVLHRGFGDTVDLRLRAVLRLYDRLLLSGTLRAESSALAPADVSPAAVDGFKIEPALAAQVRIGRFTLSAGYAFTFMPAVEVKDSTFDPTAAAACADSGGDLETPACHSRLEGRARPTAAGRYSMHAHAFSLSMGARF